MARVKLHSVAHLPMDTQTHNHGGRAVMQGVDAGAGFLKLQYSQKIVSDITNATSICSEL